ncbi:hypothetical protein [Actinoplanes sp. NPDC049316]|uniref:hypothetical protein n=1 Tax=Actinoplanes sp. NPDC049316 TaxID=3154727 RepID=UPI00342CC44D
MSSYQRLKTGLHECPCRIRVGKFGSSLALEPLRSSPSVTDGCSGLIGIVGPAERLCAAAINIMLASIVVMESKDQQIRHVVEGVALGVLAQGVDAVSSSKMDLEFAFNHAWRRWSRAAEFPSIGRAPDPGNLFWIGVGKAEGRQVVRAAWQRAQWTEPYITLEGWTVDECLDLHADERASVEDWKELGRLFVSWFKGEQLRRAG